MSKKKLVPPNIPQDIYFEDKTYKRGKAIGKGAFSYVYYLKDVDTKDKFACKVLAHEKRWSESINEIRIHKQLNHPNIVKLNKVIPIGEYNLLLMEFCYNRSLHYYMHKLKKNIQSLNDDNNDDNNENKEVTYFSNEQIMVFLQQIVFALHYIHDNRILHNDLKLGNLFLTKDMQIKIGDFGLSTKFCSLKIGDDIDYKICGTPNFASPECVDQANTNTPNKGHSYPSDIWSLGVCLYNMIYGVPPFESDDKSKSSTYKLISSVTYTFPEHPTVSEELKDIITRIFKKNPYDRITIDHLLDIVRHIE